MLYKTILFDLDGTLTKSDPGIIHAACYALERMGLTPPPPERMLRFVGPPLVVSLKDVYQMNDEDCRQAVALFQEYYNGQGWRENQVYPGIPELLSDLRRAGRTLMVATSKPDAISHQILEHFGLAEYFHHIQGAFQYESHCQKAAVIQKALADCPYEGPAVMVGDRENDCAGARENGLPTIGVLYGYGDRAELEAAGAAVIAEDVSHLGRILLEEGP